MPWKRRITPGIALFVSATLLVAILGGNVWALKAADRTSEAGRGAGDVIVNENVTLMYTVLGVEPGNILRVHAHSVASVLYSTRLPFHTYVVESGEHRLLMEGRAAEAHVYLHLAPDFYPALNATQIPAKEVPFETHFYSVKRPPVPDGVTPAPRDDTGNGLALVFFVENNATRATKVANASEKDLADHERYLWSVMPDVGGHWTNDVFVVDARLAGLQPLFYAGEALAGAAVVVTAVWYVAARRARTRPLPRDVDGSEALLRLVERAGNYLERLRNLLALFGALLVAFALTVLPRLLDGVDPGLWRYLPEPHDAWDTIIGAGFLLAFATLVAVWGLHLWEVHRELRRWRARTAAPPLDLEEPPAR